MRTVNVAELKSHLSAYLEQVRAGGEIVIRDRATPIARLVPLGADDADEEARRLVVEGKLRPPERSLPASFFTSPAPRVSRRHLVAAVKADRDED